jgi:hypothetical protein
MLKLFLIIFLFDSFSTYAQSHKKVNAGPIILIDSETKWSYKLDSLHKKITAFNEHSDSVWTSIVEFPKTEPWEVSSIWSIEIRCDAVWIGKTKYEGEKIIHISYESSCCAGCAAIVDPKSGEFQPLGCD